MMIKHFLILAALLVILPCDAVLAQRGFPLNNQPRLYAGRMEPLYHGSLDLKDYDGDGDLDVLATGRSGSFFFTKVFCQSRIIYTYQIGPQTQFDTVRTFIETPTNISDVWQSSAKWGDYDGDGDADVLVSGRTTLSGSDDIVVTTKLFEFRNNQYFEDRRSDFLDVFGGDVAWGDYDGDGDLDVIVTGGTGPSPPHVPASRLYRNDGGIFSTVATTLPNVSFGAVAWSDVDGDGDLDLALQGVTDSGGLVTDVFRNQGNGTFVALNLDIPPLSQGSFDWGDVDGDGDDDLLVSGGFLDPHLQRGLTAIFHNDGGVFRRSEAKLPGALTGAAKFGDFDLDGRMDVVISGAPAAMTQALLSFYLNNGNDFDEALSPFGLMLGDLAVADYNEDGDPDVLVSGRSSERIPYTVFYQNHMRRDLNVEDYGGVDILPDVGGNWSGCVQRQ